MKRAAVAGFAAGIAMMIGGAMGAVSNSDPKPVAEANAEVMNPMIGGQAMLPDRDIMENISSSPLHSQPETRQITASPSPIWTPRSSPATTSTFTPTADG